MTITTTTTRAIMTRAHALTRETLAIYPRADYRATLAAALRIVWEETALEDLDTLDPVFAWECLTGEEKYDRLLRMVFFRANRMVAECDHSGNFRANHYAWMKDLDDARSVAHDALLRLKPIFYPRAAAQDAADRAAQDAAAAADRAAALREKDPTSRAAILAAIDARELREKADRAALRAAAAPVTSEDLPPLSIILSRACDSAAQSTDRAEKRHARALRTETREDGTTREFIETRIYHAAEHLPDPYLETITMDAIDRAAADDTDRLIIAGRACGYTQAEIADRIDMSQRAVSKRLAAIRKRYEDEKTPAQAAAELDAKASRANRRKFGK